MLKEYIYENLNNINIEIEKINGQFYKNISEQDILKSEIRKIQEDSEIDFEIFSPRNSGNKYKNKVNAMNKKLRLLKIENDNLNKIKTDIIEKKNLFDALKDDYENIKKD